MPGPECKKIGPYKVNPQGWGIGCSKCEKHCEENHKTKKQALQWFKDHMHDHRRTWSTGMRNAIENLEAAGLIDV